MLSRTFDTIGIVVTGPVSFTVPTSPESLVLKEVTVIFAGPFRSRIIDEES